jgi:hypothetical protein
MEQSATGIRGKYVISDRPMTEEEWAPERAAVVIDAQPDTQMQAKSWELRAAMSMARPWRDQGKLANCSLRFTSGLRKVSTRAI